MTNITESLNNLIDEIKKERKAHQGGLNWTQTRDYLNQIEKIITEHQEGTSENDEEVEKLDDKITCACFCK